MLKLESIRKVNGDYSQGLCNDPKILSIFNSEFPKEVYGSLNYELEGYCQLDRSLISSSKDLANKIFAQVNYASAILIVQKNIVPSEIEKFLSLATKISKFNFQQINLGSSGDLLASFNTINAALEFLDQSLTDTSKLNLYK